MKEWEHPLIESSIVADHANSEHRIPFGQHSTGQSKENLAAELNLRGKIAAIFPSINAIHAHIDADEAYRLSRDSRVLLVEQDITTVPVATQSNPGWGLDRLDEQTPLLDNTYSYTNNGAGRTIYILDSGLTLTNSAVAAEFSGRASVIWDVNGGTGSDCYGHGTMVASAAAGNTKGVAKGATVIMAKITDACTGGAQVSTSITAFDWLRDNAPAGTIVNWSHGFTNGLNNCSTPLTNTALENAIKAAHNKGIIVVVAAGNDNCDTANFTPTRIAESFVVGATNNQRISQGKDAKAFFSRKGGNISTFAPGENVVLMNQSGSSVTNSGTSFSAPYVAGLFAIACQAAGQVCNTATSAAPLYQALRDKGKLGTVTNTDGTPLTGATSRFIWQQW
ncbi:MAG: S8 family serine peptidase [Nitrosomonas sp.]|nr:MAG: S8 family serine peptidase [Nitrosomonas sp.]